MGSAQLDKGSNSMVEFNSWKSYPQPVVEKGTKTAFELGEERRPKFGVAVSTAKAPQEQPRPGEARIASKMQSTFPCSHDGLPERAKPGFNNDRGTFLNIAADPKLLMPGEELETMPALEEPESKTKAKAKPKRKRRQATKR